jgi:hypothetical protein
VTNARRAKWWVVSATVLLLTTGLSAAPEAYKKRGCGPENRVKCRQVVEGGSAAAYLLGAGVAFLAAMFVRSRLAKPRLP